MKRIAPLAGFTLLCAVMFGTALVRAASPMESLAAEPRRGLSLYRQYCAACHGVQGLGAQAASIVGPVWAHGSSDADLTTSIRDGYPQRGMPAWGDVLSPTDVKAIIAFIRTQRPPSNAARGPLPDRVIPPSPMPSGAVRTSEATFRVETVAQVGEPYGLDLFPDGRLLVSQVDGQLLIVDKAGHSSVVQGVPRGVRPKTALRRAGLDVALSPDFATSGWIYMTWASQAPDDDTDRGNRLTLSRGRIKDGHWVDNQNLMTTPTLVTAAARIAFDRQGRVYYAVLDGAFLEAATDKPAAQDLSRPEGKILRLNPDGSAPTDNPFAGRPGANPYVWSYGHRTQVGLAFDGRGDLWETENGPRGGDELNLIQPGRNYGWPLVTWGHRYDDKMVMARPEEPGMEPPVHNWSPSPALSVIQAYRGRAFPGWTDSLLVGTFRNRSLLRVKIEDRRVVLIETLLFNVDRIMAIRTGPDGLVYVAGATGKIVRLSPIRDRAGAR